MKASVKEDTLWIGHTKTQRPQTRVAAKEQERTEKNVPNTQGETPYKPTRTVQARQGAIGGVGEKNDATREGGWDRKIRVELPGGLVT
jgi:hypothetical protein